MVLSVSMFWHVGITNISYRLRRLKQKKRKYYHFIIICGYYVSEYKT